MAAITSVGVRAPGIATTPLFSAHSTTSGTRPVLVRKRAPASRQRFAVSRSRTVPAPTTIYGYFCCQCANGLDSARNGHGDFRNRNPGVIQRLRGVKGLPVRFHANSGKDPDFFDESDDIFPFHTVSLTSHGVQMADFNNKGERTQNLFRTFLRKVFGADSESELALCR